MSEGEVLRNYINSKPGTKISIAKALGISKQSLFQYFKSEVLEKETKDRLERHFGESIFTNGQYQHLPKATDMQKPPLEQAITDLTSILLLKERNTEKMIDAFIETQKQLATQTTINGSYLKEVKDHVIVLAAMQKGYQDFWAEHATPKGLKPEEVKKDIRNKGFSHLDKIQKEGIAL